MNRNDQFRFIGRPCGIGMTANNPGGGVPNGVISHRNQNKPQFVPMVGDYQAIQTINSEGAGVPAFIGKGKYCIE